MAPTIESVAASTTASAMAALTTTITATCTINQDKPQCPSHKLTEDAIFGIVIASFVGLLIFIACIGAARHSSLIADASKIPSYKLHQKLEKRYARSVRGMEEWQVEGRKSRFKIVTHVDSEETNERTITIVEDLRRARNAEGDNSMASQSAGDPPPYAV